VLGDQLVEAAHTFDAFGQPSPSQPFADLVLDQQLANGSVLEARHPTSRPRSTSPTSRRTI